MGEVVEEEVEEVRVVIARDDEPVASGVDDVSERVDAPAAGGGGVGGDGSREARVRVRL